MANPNYQYPLEGFGDMQQNAAHHLAAQQAIGGVPGQYANSWNNMTESFRSQNGTPAGAQNAAAAVLQMSQQHQGMHPGMGLVSNQRIQPQMGRPTPGMQPTPINPPNNFRQQPSAQMPQNYGSLPVNQNPSNMMSSQLMPMGRAGSNLLPGTDPNIARQLHNINNGHVAGTGTGVLGPSRPSISNPTQTPQQPPWTVVVTTFQQKLQGYRERIQQAVVNGSIAQLTQVREELLLMTNSVQGELQKMMKQLQGVPPERVAAILKPFEDLSTQYQTLFKSVDEHVRKQVQQPNGANFMVTNFQPAQNRMPQPQPWETTTNQTPNVPGHPIMSQTPNRAPSQPDFSNNMQLQGNTSGIHGVQQPRVPIGNPAQAQEHMRKFNSIIAHFNIEPTVVVQGQPVETFKLYQLSMIFDRGNPPTHPNKFRVIGAQLGLPSENGQVSIPVANMLQECNKRVVMALESANRMQKSLPHISPGAAGLPSNAAANALILQRARQAHPQINFGDFAQESLNNIPPQVLEERIQRIVAAQQQSNFLSGTPRPPSTKPQPPATSDGVVHQQPQQPPQRPMSGVGFNVQEILRRHAECRQAWQSEMQKMQMQEERGLEERVEPPSQDTFAMWRQYLTGAFTFVRQIIPSMGFYYCLSTNEDEMRQIIHASLRVAKQRVLIAPAPPIFILRLSELEEIVKFLRPRAEGYASRINSMVNLPQELLALTRPTEAELRTLCGLMPQRTLIPQTPSQPPPPYSQHAPQNSINGSAHTPVNMPAPTPPHLPHVQQTPIGLQQRRPGFIDPSTSSPNHPTPAAAPVVAPTPPSAASPPKPKAAAAARPRVPKNKKKVANTPTPSAEPASTPTSTPSGSGLKRPHDEAETPASQPDVPPGKKLKTEAAAPVASTAPAAPPPKPLSPIKPSTPPPQLSPPVDRPSIQSAEQATELLNETFKRAEEQEVISQAQGQNSTDLFQWLSQLLSSSPVAAPPTISTPIAPTTNEEPNLSELDVAADIEFFDWGNYYSEPEGTTLPELDKHTTVSPESHNNDITTTTPPSQTTTPAQGTSTATSNLIAKDANAQTNSKSSAMSIGALPESDFTLAETGYLSPSSFPFDKTIDPWEDPWGAIA
ncbi:hypothetical protein FS842_003477 [Serendipita sp. 407]|nr:hypothetical protein FS842_003477 [Serendipita sp. 407]